MRIAAFLVLSSLVAAPAYAQAPWENQQPLPPGAVPGVPYPGYVPGAPYPPGYVRGAPYRDEAWRRRQIEADRHAHDRQVSTTHANARGEASHDPFKADQVGGGGGAAAKTGGATASTSVAATNTTSTSRTITRGAAKTSASTTTTATTTSAPPPCTDARRCAK